MPYLLLLLTAVVLLAITLPRVDHRYLFAVIAGMGTSIGVTDLVVVRLLDLYSYAPHLLASPQQDNLLGLWLADLLFVPVTFGCLIMLFPRRRILVAGGLTLALAGIEWLFRETGYFVYHNWSLLWSVGLFSLRFAIAIGWLAWLERVGYTTGFRVWLTTLSITYLWWVMTLPTRSVLALWEIRFGLLPRPGGDQAVGAFLAHGLPFYVLGMAAIWYDWARSARGLALVAAGWAGYLYLLGWTGVYHTRTGWSPLYDAAVLAGVYWACARFDDAWLARGIPTA